MSLAATTPLDTRKPQGRCGLGSVATPSAASACATASRDAAARGLTRSVTGGVMLLNVSQASTTSSGARASQRPTSHSGWAWVTAQVFDPLIAMGIDRPGGTGRQGPPVAGREPAEHDVDETRGTRLAGRTHLPDGVVDDRRRRHTAQEEELIRRQPQRQQHLEIELGQPHA